MIILIKFITMLIGCSVGSFVNVVILRLPLKKDIAWDRSNCPNCQNVIKWYDNIPIFSFAILRGKCRFCKKNISWQYPFIELAHGIIFYALMSDWWELSLKNNLLNISTFSVASIFIAHFIIDLRYKLLLDKLNLALLVPVLGIVIISENYKSALLGGALGFALPLAVTWLFYLIKGKIGLGGGDIKLFGILGILFGVKGVFLNLFTSCIFGSVLTIILILSKRVKRDEYIPFGPYIISVAMVQLLLPEYFSMWENFLIPYY